MLNRALAPLGGLALAVMLAAAPAWAQDAPPPAEAAPIDPATIPMPNLAFRPTRADESNYDKYFYFNRADTDFATAYADLQECDDYARDLPRSGPRPYAEAPYPYAGTVAGAVGGALGNALAGAILEAGESAKRRRLRRSIMRTCMGFKGYQVFGLRKSLWEAFNFEEGSRRIEEAERQRLLRIQARVASGPRPTVGEIGR